MTKVNLSSGSTSLYIGDSHPIIVDVHSLHLEVIGEIQLVVPALHGIRREWA